MHSKSSYGTGHHGSGTIHHAKGIHADESEIFKRSSMSAQRRRRILSRVTFVTLTALAAAIVAACIIVSL